MGFLWYNGFKGGDSSYGRKHEYFCRTSSVHVEWYAVLRSFDLSLPNGHHLQYSDVFSSLEKFRTFFKEFEEVIAKNKLWMDEKVRFHLQLMAGYFSWINALLVGIARIPLPG